MIPYADDVAAPLKQLLRDLALLEDEAPGDVTLRKGTPESLQVIRAGALDVTKVWTSITGAAGLAGAVTTLGAAWKAAPDNLQITLVGGASVILAATAIAIALIIRSDVAGRATTTAALYRSRAQVSNAFLASLVAVGPTSGGGSTPTDTLTKLLGAFQVKVPGQAASPGLYGLRKKSASGPYELRRGDGDWVDLSPKVTFEVELPLPRSSA